MPHKKGHRGTLFLGKAFDTVEATKKRIEAGKKVLAGSQGRKQTSVEQFGVPNTNVQNFRREF